ncbi:MAG: DUF560 domain-containing protein [Elusimicrobia bacterium]|nr:DUF560 domain-containing protein [Elusimicrobiota bacterium]
MTRIIQAARLAICAAFALAVVSGRAHAQATQQAEEQSVQKAQEQRRETGAQKQARQAESQARLKSAAEGEDVTYDQILADPDNIDLNFKWARQQVRDGEIKGASSTLERILLIKPSLARARLLYAVVLYRLDNLDEASRQLDTLESVAIADEIRKEAKQYRTLIAGRKRSTHVNALLGFGWGYDTNRNAAPSTGKALFAGSPIQLTANSLRRDDTSITLLGSLGLTHDLGTQAGHSLFGNFTYYQGEQTLMKTLNIKAYSFRAGGVIKHWYANLTPTLIFDHVQLAQTTFLRTRGGELRADHKLSRRSDVYVQAGYQYQQYSRTALVPTAEERNGNQWDFGAGYGYWLTPNQRLVPSYNYQIKNAVRLYNAYTRNALGLEHTWLLGKGTFLLSSVTANFDRYVKEDAILAPWDRQDDTYRLRATYGAPLSLVWKPLKDFLGTLTYEYYHALSNLPNYSYDNTKIMGMLTYSWGY